MNLTPSPKIFIQFCEQSGLPKPIPEYKFHPTRKWRADWFFLANGKMVALEQEGAVWQNGRHTRGSGFVKDMAKYNAMAMQGIYLLRVQPKDLLKKSTVEMVRTCLDLKQ